MSVIVNDVTQNLALPLPNGLNELADDIARLRSTLSQIDTYLAGLLAHAHAGVYEPADATILKAAAIGVSVQAYDVDIATVAASQAEMQAGTEGALRSMSPLLVAQAIGALSKRLLWVDKVASHTAVAWQGTLANTSGGAWTLTLPANPAVGDTIGVIDVASSFGAAPLTIARNGQKIMGLAENMTCSTNGLAFELVYQGAAYGWRIF